MRGLYAIVDVEALGKRGLDPVRFAQSVIEARPAALQVRDKLGGARRTLALLKAIAPVAASAGVRVFANDRPDLALIAGVSGVHVGQDDLPVDAIRSLAIALGKPLRVGLSTHDPADVEAAIAGGGEPAPSTVPDYLAIGPIYATSSKADASPVVGLSRLTALAERVRLARPRLPIVAIGGIHHGNAAEIARVVSVVAVIQALLPDAAGPSAYEEATERARALHETVVRAAR